MQITHDEARRLIQFKTDNRLNAINEEKLNIHLKSCRECQRYFDSIKETESILRQTLRKQWNVHPLPLQMDAIYAKAISNPGASILMPTRKALIGVAFVMFAFMAWQSMINTTSSPAPLGTLPMIPTPMIQNTATNTLQTECKELRYIVQQNDTLDSIATHFSVSKESIITVNSMTSNAIDPGKELIIPPCESTPTSTILPPAFTITPNLEIISTTPG